MTKEKLIKKLKNILELKKCKFSAKKVQITEIIK